MPSWSRALARASIVAALCAAGLLLLQARPAGAHAVLVSSSPGDGARLEVPPTEVRLEFNEPVSADLGGLRVFDGDGNRVDRGAVRSTGLTLAVDLEDDLRPGAYVAAYRVVSADSHPIRGGIVFTVGDADSTGVSIDRFFSSESERGWEVAGAVGRWLAMAGTLVGAGGTAFVAFCDPAAGPAARRWIRVGGVVGAIGLLWAIPVQAALATGQGASSLFEDGVLRSVLGDGLGWSIGLGVAGIAAFCLALERFQPLAVAGAAVAAGSFALSGHTRVDDVAVGMVSGVAHVGAAAVWTGGLALLVLALRSGPAVPERIRLVGRFSQLAAVSILAVGAAGVVLAWTEVKALDALTSTAYGWTLLAKVAVVAGVVGVGAHNRYRLIPRLREDPDEHGAWQRLRRAVSVELAGVAVAVGLTAVLVNLVPAGVAAGVGQIHSEILDLGGAGSVQLVVDPNQAGENTVHLYFYAPDGRPAEIAEDVRLEFRKPSDDIGPISRVPFRAGPAHFQHDGTELVTRGRWEITVVARLSRFAEETATAEVLVGG